jgi:hypothetical protein
MDFLTRNFVFSACAVLVGCGSPPAARPALPPPEKKAEARKPAPSPEIPALSSDKFLALVEKELGRPKVSWKNLEVELELRKQGRAAGVIYYKQQPSGYAEVTEDTKRLVRAMLAVLMKNGISPSELMLTVTGRGRQETTGETGKNQVRVYGRSMWNQWTDSIDFTKDK